MARQIDLFCTPQLMDAGVPQPLRTADQQRQRRGCQSPSVTELAASGQLLMTAAFPCPGCCCEYLTTAARIAGSSSRYAGVQHFQDDRISLA
jgi:hypothetical protein